MNGASEWAYGVTDWFEQGLYLPVYSPHSEGRGATINGFKLRELFVRPHAADHTFFYGVNYEFSVNASYWEFRRITSEVRPIVGVHLHPVDLIFNPDCGHQLARRFWQPGIRSRHANCLQREQQLGCCCRGVRGCGTAASLLQPPRSIPRGLGRRGSHHQDRKHRGRRRGRRDCRVRPVDIQADGVAGSDSRPKN